jgi:hypothetical protein
VVFIDEIDSVLSLIRFLSLWVAKRSWLSRWLSRVLSRIGNPPMNRSIWGRYAIAHHDISLAVETAATQTKPAFAGYRKLNFR